jgi:DNA-binding response OmpR family regulator
MQALLFSSHPDEAAVFTVILHQIGFTVRAVRSLDQAIESWPEQPSDFILISLTDETPVSIKQISQIRAHTVVPIVFITDLLSEDIQVRFLDEGADLLITRPYNIRTLGAQIRALLRRSGSVPFFSLPTLTQKGVSLDPSDRTVKVGEAEPHKLTQLEFRLLYTLMTHPGQIIPSEQIVEHVWGYAGEGNRELVRGLVQRLRSKVEPNPREPLYILTEPGIGYSFCR